MSQSQIQDSIQIAGDQMRHPPYHLRTNKAVDRLLLADIVRKVGKLKRKYEKFTYHSLAGPFLEDLRVMDHFFPEMSLISLESNLQTYKRQEFHRFNSRLNLKSKTLSDFLKQEYQPGLVDIFWLDYTDLTVAHLEEFQDVLKRVPPMSIVRITLRAEPQVDIDLLKSHVPEEYLQQMEAEFERKFRNEFVKFLPHSVETGAFIKAKAFARMVQLMVRRAASDALDFSGSKVDFLPIQSTCYDDNTYMLSVTGVVYPRSEKTKTRKLFESVRYADFDWNEPNVIDIPSLSMKERLFLERLLPIPSEKNSGEELFNALGYMIDNGVNRSTKQLEHYADCHRDYPNFVRILI